jgi:hypothetical protein
MSRAVILFEEHTSCENSECETYRSSPFYTVILRERSDRRISARPYRVFTYQAETLTMKGPVPSHFVQGDKNEVISSCLKSTYPLRRSEESRPVCIVILSGAKDLVLAV